MFWKGTMSTKMSPFMNCTYCMIKIQCPTLTHITPACIPLYKHSTQYSHSTPTTELALLKVCVHLINQDLVVGLTAAGHPSCRPSKLFVSSRSLSLSWSLSLSLLGREWREPSIASVLISWFASLGSWLKCHQVFRANFTHGKPPFV